MLKKQSSPMSCNREISNAKAESFYDGLLLLSGATWCAFILQNWTTLASACAVVEDTIQTGDLGRTKEQLNHALAALSKINSMIRTVPQTAEEWCAFDNCVRDCLAALGCDPNLLPKPNAHWEG